MVENAQVERAIWSIADGRGSDDDHALLRRTGTAVLPLLHRIIDEVEADLEAVRGLNTDERSQVVADFVGTVDGLRQIATSLRQPNGTERIEIRPLDAAMLRAALGDGQDDEFDPGIAVEADAVRLHASWADDRVVVWAGGRGATPATNEELSTRLETSGAPPHGWEAHTGVQLPGGDRAEALSISVDAALGWLAALGRGQGGDDIGDSLTWMGRVALEGVRHAARGALVPGLLVTGGDNSRAVEARVRWRPALVDGKRIDALAAAMPGTVPALTRTTPRAATVDIVTSVVDAIARAGAARLDVPARPPTANSPIDLADTIVASMNGAPFAAERDLARDMSRRLDQWTRSVTNDRRPLVVRLDPPGAQGVWTVSVHVNESNKLQPIDVKLRAGEVRGPLAAEWARLSLVFAPLDRANRQTRGRVALSQAEAWDFMANTGPMLASIGFEVRAPEISRHAARPTLNLFTEARPESKVGANQLSNVSWTVQFGDVQLTSADIARLASQSRPLIESHGKWIAIDRVDLEQAAAALAERESITQLTGAEILRHSIGLDASGLAGGIVVHGDSWASAIVERARGLHDGDALITQPDNFNGVLRSYQADALAWIGFLSASDLGGCLALDMGLGKTPTVLAHLAGIAEHGAALVIAPAAVVGNWAAEAAKFARDLRVVVHHGAQRATSAEFAEEIADADLVITTYATAVRDIDALADVQWQTIVLDEAQAIKNSSSETAQQLRRLSGHTKLALTGTPIENGVGDLWAILDFTNPGLVGPRPAFVAQLAGDGESALRSLNGILLFRRTKSEPEVAAELPDKIDELDHCTMTPEQIGLYQAVLDDLVVKAADPIAGAGQGAILAAITALKQICNHPAAYHDDGSPLTGRSGKLTRLEELLESVFAAGERALVFTHFAQWGRKLAVHLSEVTGLDIPCYDGDLSRTTRDRMVADFQNGTGPGAMVLSLKAGGTGLNLTAANHVVLYDRWWNPAVEDQARDRAWRIGQSHTVISHRLVCPGTIDERVEEVVQGKRHIANIVLPKSSSIADLNAEQLRVAFGLREDELLTGDDQ
jgi:hypothetical protein